MQSFEDIVNQLEKLNNEFNKLCEMLEYEEVLEDKKLFLHLDKKKHSLKPLIDIYNNYLQMLKNIEDLNNIILTDKTEDFNNELLIEKQNLENLQQQIIKLFYLQESSEGQILIEIVKNKDELTNKLTDILLSAYSNFLKSNFCNYNITYKNNSVFISATGQNIKNFFEQEKGTHFIRLQENESFCYVFIYFDVPNITYNFSDSELQITACRSSGAGGQHINKTESSIKIVHLPTGLVGISQDERSQFQNKQKALARLKDKVQNYLDKQRNDKITTDRKQQLKQLRTVKTYNLDTSKIVNNFNNKQINLEDFLNGKILN